MCDARIIFRFAGGFVLLSVALAYWVHPGWLLFTAFVGANLLQTSFTSFCPLERILGRLAGMEEAAIPPELDALMRKLIEAETDERAEMFALELRAQVQGINEARERVWITTPYFVPDEPIVAALSAAALRVSWKTPCM